MAQSISAVMAALADVKQDNKRKRDEVKEPNSSDEKQGRSKKPRVTATKKNSENNSENKNEGSSDQNIGFNGKLGGIIKLMKGIDEVMMSTKAEDNEQGPSKKPRVTTTENNNENKDEDSFELKIKKIIESKKNLKEIMISTQVELEAKDPRLAKSFGKVFEDIENNRFSEFMLLFKAKETYAELLTCAFNLDKDLKTACLFVKLVIDESQKCLMMKSPALLKKEDENSALAGEIQGNEDPQLAIASENTANNNSPGFKMN